MTKLRENLINRMIRIYGFENPIIIDFCKICESFPETEEYNKTLKTLVIVHEECPVLEEE